MGKRNIEGYADITAVDAISNATSAEKHEREIEFNKLIKSIHAMCVKNGFYIENRLVIKDKKTGKIYK